MPRNRRTRVKKVSNPCGDRYARHFIEKHMRFAYSPTGRKGPAKLRVWVSRDTCAVCELESLTFCKYPCPPPTG